MLRGERVVLRGKRREDMPVQFEHDNDLEVLLVADDGPPVPWPLERLYRSFDRQAEEHDDSHTWFVIEVEGKVIGRCGLSRFHLTDRTCFLGIVIGEKEYWGRGYGREAIRLLLDYAFRYRNMRKVYLSTGSHNERALRCYRACGFVEEGRLRQQQWCAGEYIDVVYMGLLREEWQARASEGE
jgi:RimJ/RimL family protein N-acetyltransferase